MAEKSSKIKGFEGFRLLFRGTKNTKKIPPFSPFCPLFVPLKITDNMDIFNLFFFLLF